MISVAEVNYVEATWVMIVKSLVIFAVIFGILPLLTVLERKLIGRFQHRYGPNRVGPFGILQPLADVGKLLSKEAFRPANAIPTLFILGPLLPVLSGVLALAIIPWGNVQDGVGPVRNRRPNRHPLLLRGRLTRLLRTTARWLVLGLQVQLLGGDALGGTADLL